MSITSGDLYNSAMKVQTQEEADEFFEALMVFCLIEFVQEREEAARVMRSNIGYWTGYCSDETAIRVQRLFQCEHPVFGSMEHDGPPTPEEALRKGIEIGRRTK